MWTNFCVSMSSCSNILYRKLYCNQSNMTDYIYIWKYLWSLLFKLISVQFHSKHTVSITVSLSLDIRHCFKFHFCCCNKISCDKIVTKNNLGETMFILTHISRLQLISERTSRRQEPKTHPQSRADKE